MQTPSEQVQSQSRGKKWGRGVLNKSASPTNTNLNMKSDMDIHTATSVPSPQTHPAVLRPNSLAAGSSSHPPTTRPLAPLVGAIWPAPASNSACTALIRYSSGARHPFTTLNPAHVAQTEIWLWTTLIFPPSRASQKLHNFLTPQQPILTIVLFKIFIHQWFPNFLCF